MPAHTDESAWPAQLRPGAVRFGRASRHYDRTIAFYRDLVGLPVVGEFTASFGEDGTIFGLPDTTVQLEIIRAHEPTAGAALDQLVLYLDNTAAVAAATAPMRGVGLTAHPDPHPYWAANGAVIYRDPDGRDVVFAPWVYGRDPDPVDRRDPLPEREAPLRVEWYDGDRDVLRTLFTEAEDSAQQLDSYINDGRVLVAWRGRHPVGHLQLVTNGAGTVELKNMAVVEDLRGTGIGRTLVTAALAAATRDGARRMLVATAAADVGNLRFYQRCGFRFASLERDAFAPETGYPERIMIGGIPLRDRVWLDQTLDA
jgi:GNAT superfamily N-acetyltransferase